MYFLQHCDNHVQDTPYPDTSTFHRAVAITRHIFASDRGLVEQVQRVRPRSGGADPRTPDAHQGGTQNRHTAHVQCTPRVWPERAWTGRRTHSVSRNRDVRPPCDGSCDVRRTVGRAAVSRARDSQARWRTSALVQQPLLGARPTWNSAAGAPAFVSSAHESLKAGTPSADRDRDS